MNTDNQQFDTPILFLIFNRPDTTSLVFEKIREIKPKKLYVVSDGPRENVPEDIEKVQQTKKIIDTVDWPCEIKKEYSPTNLGCKNRVSSGITWFFENEEKGIILEDDCLPDTSFFKFCEELLEKYRDNESIMMISGDNFQDGIKRGEASYYFSKLPHIWGWATWRRAWKHYDLSMSTFPDFKKTNQISKMWKEKVAQRYWILVLERVFNKKVDTWDTQWLYTIWKNNGMSICPNVNLVKNIGFREDATHTKNVSKYDDIKVESIKTIKHPVTIEINMVADNYENNKRYNGSSLIIKIKKFFNI